MMNDELKMLDRSKCIADDNEYAGKLLIIKPSSLKEEFRQPYFQYFYAASGFGCYPDKLGGKVYGKFLADGEECCFRRSDFIGVADKEHFHHQLLKLKFSDRISIIIIYAISIIFSVVSVLYVIGDTIEALIIYLFLMLLLLFIILKTDILYNHHKKTNDKSKKA